MMAFLLMLGNTLLMAFREIRRNTMRSTLTTLGIIIGVGAVIALVTLGQGATQKVTSDVASIGVNMLTLSPGAERRGPGAQVQAAPLTLEDATAIEREISLVAAVAPSSGRGTLVVYGNLNWNTTVTGTTNDYYVVRALKIAAGRQFSDMELQGGSPVCVLGATVVRELFGHQDPLGASIRVGKVSCQVIGTIESKGSSTFGMDQDDFILMPLLAFQRRLSGNRNISSIAISAVSENDTEKVKEQVTALMRERRRVAFSAADDFNVRDMK